MLQDQPTKDKTYPMLEASNVAFLQEALGEMGYPIPTIHMILETIDRKAAAVEAAKAEKEEADKSRGSFSRPSAAEMQAIKALGLDRTLEQRKSDFAAKYAALAAEPERVKAEAAELARQYGYTGGSRG